MAHHEQSHSLACIMACMRALRSPVVDSIAAGGVELEKNGSKLRAAIRILAEAAGL